MGRYYTPLKKSDYKILDKGGNVKCPYNKCLGMVFKTSDLNGEEIYTEYEFYASIHYRCSKDPENHFWGHDRILN